MNKQTDPFEVGKWAILALGGFVAYKALRGLGLIKSSEEKKEEKQIKDIDIGKFEPLNPKFWNKLRYEYPKNRVKIISANDAEVYKKNIIASSGIFNDDEAALYKVFNSLPTQSAVSYFADQFSKKTNKDLLTYVTDMLNDNEKLKLITEGEVSI